MTALIIALLTPPAAAAALWWAMKPSKKPATAPQPAPGHPPPYLEVPAPEASPAPRASWGQFLNEWQARFVVIQLALMTLALLALGVVLVWLWVTLAPPPPTPPTPPTPPEVENPTPPPPPPPVLPMAQAYAESFRASAERIRRLQAAITQARSELEDLQSAGARDIDTDGIAINALARHLDRSASGDSDRLGYAKLLDAEAARLLSGLPATVPPAQLSVRADGWEGAARTVAKVIRRDADYVRKALERHIARERLLRDGLPAHAERRRP